MDIHPLVKTITERELRFIAALDYAQDVERHLDALRAVIFQQDGHIMEHQNWFPLEVIELGAYSLEPRHEREFFFCTLLVLQALQNGESSVDPEILHENSRKYYDQLAPELRHEVLLSFQRVMP